MLSWEHWYLWFGELLPIGLLIPSHLGIRTCCKHVVRHGFNKFTIGWISVALSIHMLCNTCFNINVWITFCCTWTGRPYRLSMWESLQGTVRADYTTTVRLRAHEKWAGVADWTFPDPAGGWSGSESRWQLAQGSGEQTVNNGHQYASSINPAAFTVTQQCQAQRPMKGQTSRPTAPPCCHQHIHLPTREVQAARQKQTAETEMKTEWERKGQWQEGEDCRRGRTKG